MSTLKNTALVITSIAGPSHPVLKTFAEEAKNFHVPFILIGDTKSPEDFSLQGCDYYSIERQRSLSFRLSASLPVKHYARKNIGYLIAMKNGAGILVETDDDNIPMPDFWKQRERKVSARSLPEGWHNVYGYFSDTGIWPRGFALEHLHDQPAPAIKVDSMECPIQQGLADDNPDVDAIFRLTRSLPVVFSKNDPVVLGRGAVCPFNSQNTTWFKEAFPLLYLPSFCSFRMTDIWRSFVALRIGWTCGFNVLFHRSTVRQERNDHSLIDDFRDEVPGYLNNGRIMKALTELELQPGIRNIPSNMLHCYQLLTDMQITGEGEMDLLRDWLADIEPFTA